jgi:hypothetical protein
VLWISCRQASGASVMPETITAPEGADYRKSFR